MVALENDESSREMSILKKVESTETADRGSNQGTDPFD